MYVSVEMLERSKYSIAHYWEQNGDLMRDPDMEFVSLREERFTRYTSDRMVHAVEKTRFFNIMKMEQFLSMPGSSQALQPLQILGW